MCNGTSEFENLPLYTSYIKIFMIILLVMDEVYLDVAFVHPFQEFLIKLVMASGKFILEINWNFCNHRTKVKKYGNQIRYL